MRISDLRRLLEPVRVRLRAIVARAVVVRTDDAPGVQSLQANLGHREIRDKLEHLQPYGFRSRPIAGAEAIVLAPAGDRAGAVVVVVADRRHRPDGLDEGEVAIYTDEGTSIRLERGGRVRISAAELVVEAEQTVEIEAGTSITLRAPAINLDPA